MRNIVLRFGLLAGLVIVALGAVMLPLCMSGRLSFDLSVVLGYSTQVLAYLMVFFGIRSYRESVGGAISFGKAFQVGILITLVTCAIYVVTWEIAYFNFFPDFLDKYAAHALGRLRESGASPEEIAATEQQMAEFAKSYDNVLFNSAVTFTEIFPAGLIVTLVSAAILRRPAGSAAEPVPA